MGRLILTRSPGESIVIGDDTIRVTVQSVNGRQVRLSIEAPQQFTIDREELYLRKKLGLQRQAKQPLVE